jgi:hypothetical protein
MERLPVRVARFFLVQQTEMGKNILNGHKTDQTGKNLPLQGLPKCTTIGSFGTKIPHHLATLLPISARSASPFQEPILRLVNLQLQLQRCSRLERF